MFSSRCFAALVVCPQLLLMTEVSGFMAKSNEPCQSDADCLEQYETCSFQEAAESLEGETSDWSEGDTWTEGARGVCVHKSLFPMLAAEFYACFAVVALLAFTNTGGLGGGGILVPAMIGLYRFDTRNAVSISNFSIAVSTSIRYILNLKKSHPLKNGRGTLIDYNVTMLMLPGVIVGTSLGSIVNLSLPGPVLCGGFILCNVVIAAIAIRNFFKIRKVENAAQLQPTESVETQGQPQASNKVQPQICANKQEILPEIELVRTLTLKTAFSDDNAPDTKRALVKSNESKRDSDTNPGERSPTSPEDSHSPKLPRTLSRQETCDPLSGSQVSDRSLNEKQSASSLKRPDSLEQNPKLKAIEKREGSNFQPVKLGQNLGMLVILFLVQLLRGSGQEPSIVGVERCSASDWTIFGCLILMGLIMTFFAVVYVRREYQYKKTIGYVFSDGDFQCTSSNAVKMPLYAVVCGFLCSTTGVGPGAFYNTLLLQLNLHTEVATATGQYLGTFTGVAATICMLIYGELNLEYSFVINLLTVFGTILGLRFSKGIIAHTNGKTQYIVLFLIVVILTILLSTAGLAATEMSEKHKQQIPIFESSSYC